MKLLLADNIATHLKIYLLKDGLSSSKKVVFSCFSERSQMMKMMKNPFYFMLKALFALEIFTFLVRLFGWVEKWLDKKAMVNFEIHEVTDWTKNNCNMHIAQYLNT